MTTITTTLQFHEACTQLSATAEEVRRLDKEITRLENEVKSLRDNRQFTQSRRDQLISAILKHLQSPPVAAPSAD